ncbi:hypothetical protein [Haloarcula limicola]|nr:hypothetical protein [Halomicroarcula limicola]
MATQTKSDMGVGLGLVLGLVAVGAAVMTALYSYNYAIVHAQGGETAGLLANSGVAFGVAMLAAGLALVAIHAYDG